MPVRANNEHKVGIASISIDAGKLSTLTKTDNSRRNRVTTFSYPIIASFPLIKIIYKKLQNNGNDGVSLVSIRIFGAFYYLVSKGVKEVPIVIVQKFKVVILMENLFN